MKKILQILLPLLLLGGAFFIGTRVGHFHAMKKHHRGPMSAAGMDSKFANKHMNRMKKKLVHRLDLDSAQQNDLDRLFSKKREDMKKLRKEFMPRLREHKREMSQQIMALLKPEQKKKFQKMEQRRKERAKKRRKRRGQREEHRGGLELGSDEVQNSIVSLE